ncbi:tyrosine-type recombinase/integrase [Tropicimonas sediminicola]|uniref:Site-specific recombinase XerD n=1 Tax=Tropicimonas sediminicola TaxID=1031541 RepID=A0A239FL55_9RHOB|nr:site-specific integrase [Tropicimonas sediminicola]SNS56724.1 Site-specific recombinase XerD [Tropicimonas sediminicola]
MLEAPTRPHDRHRLRKPAIPTDTYDLTTAIATLADEAAQRGTDPRAITKALMQVALETGIRRELRSTVQLALEQASGDAPKELTDLACRRLKPGNRLSDPQFAGLMLVASTRGKRWVLRSQAGGKQRQKTVGHYPALTLAEAREKWVTIKSEGWNTAPADKRSETTLEALVDHYVDHLKAKGNRSWQRTLKVLQKHLLDKHAAMPLADVTAEVLEGCYEHLIDTQPGTAHNIRAPLSAMMNWAEAQKRLPVGMTAPKLKDTRRAKVKEYHPGTSELRTMLQGLDTLKPEYADILRLQALTGCRISEVCGADWSEISLDERRWTIPGERMKNKEQHIVMLSDQAIALLERQPTRTGTVFGKTAPTREHVSKLWATRRDELGLPKAFTSHTLRKALGSWLAESGEGLDMRDRMLAHSRGGVDKHYNLALLNQPAAKCWQKWADRLDAIETGGSVVLIDEVRA